MTKSLHHEDLDRPTNRRFMAQNVAAMIRVFGMAAIYVKERTCHEMKLRNIQTTNLDLEEMLAKLNSEKEKLEGKRTHGPSSMRRCWV